MKAHLVWDLQFGSTGKGLLAGWIANVVGADSCVCAFSPNAGHTYVDEYDRKYVHTMLPIAATAPSVRRVHIGPGAVVNFESLRREIDFLEETGGRKLGRDYNLYIHENIAVVTEADREAEKVLNVIGSTQKGSMEATIRKMRRGMQRDEWPEWADQYSVSPEWFTRSLSIAGNLIVEGAQGYSLSLHHGIYPYVTSRDTTPHQILADCAVPWGHETEIYGCARTHPIRVANRHNPEGEQIGFSGPCYFDQYELNWDALGVKPELTTVTRLPRRVFTFSPAQIREAMQIGRCDTVFLNFCNYVKNPVELEEMTSVFRRENPRVKMIYGYGPSHWDIKDYIRGDFYG